MFPNRLCQLESVCADSVIVCVCVKVISQLHLLLTYTNAAKGSTVSAETVTIKVTTEIVCLHGWQCGNCAVIYRIMKYILSIY